MRLRSFFFGATLLLGLQSFGQKEKPSALTDTTIYDYDEIFSELDLLLDSLYTPRSFLIANLGVGSGVFQYNIPSGNTTLTKRKGVFSPSLGYFHKSGFGVSGSASFLTGGTSNPWQYSLTGSYDYLQKRAFIAGLSLTHYFIKKELPFYTSPLQKEAFGYFTYRHHWLKPSLNASFGWGSRSAVEQRTEMIEAIKKEKKRNGNGNGNGGNNGSGGTTITTVSSYEKIIDVNLQLSIRYDFYFLHLFSQNDYVRLTPQILLTAGSQQFGFNSTINSTIIGGRSGKNNLSRTQKVALNNNLAFRPLALTTQLRTEYAKGLFFVQPQVFFNYHFPEQRQPFTTTFLLTTGVIL